MADDDDPIFVDVVPRLDENAADDAVDKLQDKFKDVTTSLGEKLTTATTDAFRDISARAHGWGEDVSRKLADSVSDALEQGRYGDIIGDMGRTLKDSLGGVGDIGDKLGGVFGDLKSGNLGGLPDALKDLHIGGLDGLTDALGKLSGIPDALKNIGGPDLTGVNDLLDKMMGTKGSPGLLDQLLTGLPNMPKGIPGGDILNAIPYMEDARRFAEGADNAIDQGSGIGHWLESHTPAALGKNSREWVNRNIPRLWGHDPVHGSSDASDMVSMGDLPNLSHAMRVGIDGGAGARIPSSISTSTMGVSASVVNVNGATSGGGGSSSHAVAGSSSHGASLGHAGAGGLSHKAVTGHGIGSAGSVGGYSTGGILPGDSPGYDNLLGVLPSGKAVGLEGGEGVVNPNAMSVPGVADLVTGLNTHYAGGTIGRGGIVGGPERGPAPGPKPGSRDDDESGSVGGTPPNKQTEPEGSIHGTGKGFGIGGGLIGAAEGAAAMAAGMGSFGGGSVAAQLGFEELNRAAGYGGQVAGILGIEMPLDTLSVNGGKAANLGKNIIGKIGLGMVGSHNPTDNVAGQTKPPIPPTQPPAEVPNQPIETVGGRPAPGSGSAAIHIENQHINNHNGGSNVEQTLQRTGNMWLSSNSP